MTADARDFPADFLWGAATSAHQVEGGNIHNDWWAWEQAGRVPEASGRACEQYERYEADFDLAAHVGHNCHRFSVEWSRLEPAPGRWNDEALGHYRRVVRALRARRLEPIVTLCHFTVPQWLAERGGWTSPVAVEAFAGYVRRVVEALSADVRWWVTVNEPVVLAYQGYLAGVWPPGRRSGRAAWQVLRHLLQAHEVAYQIIHAADRPRPTAPARVSIAQYQLIAAPCRPSSLGDRLTAAIRQFTANDMVLRSLRKHLDYVGLNYYMRDFVRGNWWPRPNPLGPVCPPAHHPEAGERSSLGWEIYPSGLEALLRVAASYRLPILITENGVAATDDRQRLRFLQAHLAAVARARAAGAPVVGYCHWSLLDNFEWERGYAPRFGLIEVDYATQARRIRESARWYAGVCRTGRLGP